MPIQRTQGKRRVGNYRTDEFPASPTPTITAIAAPDHDKRTGRFVAGNGASRRRKLTRVAAELTTIDPAKCDPWLRPAVTMAVKQASELIDSLAIDSPALRMLAADAATARAVYLALLQLGAQGDPKALEQARGWLRETRQSLLALKGMANDEAASADAGPVDLSVFTDEANEQS